MVRRAPCVVMMLLLALLSSAAMAVPFIYAAETYAQPDDWYTAFPYQRNAMIDFATNPSNWPVDPANGSARDLLPGVNYGLEGTHDAALYASDWLQITGEYSWLPTDLLLGSSRTGILFFDNRGSGTARQISLTWHLDNLALNNLRKDIWSELIWLQSNQNTAVNILLTTQPGFEVKKLYYAFPAPIQQSDGWLADDGYGQIMRNPEWEEATLLVNIAPHDFFAIDSWHTATECVPEPGTWALFGVGLAAILLGRRRCAA
jgi:hypothetical protein